MGKYRAQLTGLLLITVAVGAAMFFGIDTVLAQADAFGLQEIQDSDIGLGSDRSIQEIVARIINVFLGLLGIIALVLIVYGGFVYMTAGGAEDRVARAKQILVNATIGLVIIMSAWAITRFVISKLSEATGNGEVNFGEGGPGAGNDCVGVGLCNPAGGGNEVDQCLEAGNHFVVKSISPNTDATGMTNVTVRALFSSAMDANLDPAAAVIVRQGNNPVQPSESTWIDNKLVELRFHAETDGCDPEVQESCLAAEAFSIEIPEDIVDANGRELEIENECGDFPRQAEFTNDSDVLDVDAPRVEGGIHINGQSQEGVDENGFVVRVGRHYAITATVADRKGEAGEELIVDGDMEAQGADNFTPWGGVVHYEKTNFEPYGGNQSMLINTVGTHSGLVMGQIDVEPAKTYLFTFRYKLDSGQLLTLQSIRNANVDFENGRDTLLPTGGKWKYFSRVFTLPNQFQGIFRSVITIRDGIGYVDNISLRPFVQGGVSHMSLDVSREDADGQVDRLSTYHTGPRVIDGSDGPEDFFYDLFLGANIPTPSRYEVTVRSSDLDGNETVSQTHLILVGEQCNRPGHENDPECLQNDECNANWQCASRQCANGQCLAYPMITDVSPEWNGAAGNLITIEGQFFGEAEGTVEFGADVDGSGVVEEGEWVVAQPPEFCPMDMWSEREVIVAVPNGLDVGALAALRVTRADAAQEEDPLSDTSIDDHGPKPGPQRNGLFEINEQQRPGLCGFLRGNVPTEAELPEVEIFAIGTGFGQVQSRVLFGGIESRIQQWGEETILVQVPRIEPGLVGVQVDVGGIKSNGKRFTVGDPNFGGDQLPTITDVDPGETTPLSLLTVHGRDFGATSGDIYLAQTIDQVRDCPVLLAEANDAEIANGCIRLSFQLPAACGETWFDDHVIAVVPELAPAGQYKMMLQTHDGQQSNGENDFSIVEGPQQPGICRLVPDNGSAPLREGDSPLTMTGFGFGANPKVYFTGIGSDLADIQTWLNSEDHTDQDGDQVVTALLEEDGMLKTRVPVSADGRSMDVGIGRIKFATGVDQQESNSVAYTVNDCRESNRDLAGFHCCASGADEGRWVSNGESCEGESRDGGYVWRFSTGVIPRYPSVIEACNVDEWGNENAAIGLPSPAPWAQNPQGENTCLNASILVRFDIGIKGNTIDADADNIHVYTCEDDDGEIDCSGDNKVPVDFDLWLHYAGGALTIHRGNDPALQPQTWYQVELDDEILSQEQIQVLGRPAEVNYPLQATRPCGNGTAYCFSFKTSDGLCELQAAGIHPDAYTTHHLGTIHDPRFPRAQEADPGDLFFTAHPLYYMLWGAGDRVCQVMDVDGLGWDWTSENPAQASVQVAPEQDVFIDSRATVQGLIHTAPQLVDIYADLGEDDQFGPRQARSELIVDLADPAVIDRWPECTASCTNAEIGVRFNRVMMVEDYARGFIVKPCTNETCEVLEAGLELDLSGSGPEVIHAIPPRLEEGTWYKVNVTSDIRSVGSLVGGDENRPIPGPAVEPDEWKFRTKTVDGFCKVERVALKPDPYTARNIGQKTRYDAVPFSSPNECSSVGQALDPWDYGWQWSTTEVEVATVSHIESEGIEPAYCTAQCIAAGSNIARGEAGIAPLCGNGVVDAGEDCDIADEDIDERPGVSCSYNCLRPGNDVAPAVCGNGALEPWEGEECDPGIDGQEAICSERCTRIGSSTVPSDGDLDDVWCGSGEVTGGEECDIDITPEDAVRLGLEPNAVGQGCSQQCLHEGTTLSAVWCAENQGNLNNMPGALEACRTAVSVCGNAVVEQGEECEILEGDTIAVVGGDGNQQITVAEGTAANHCTSSCTLRNICNFNQLPNRVPTVEQDGVRCDPNSKGCSVQECRIIGGSVTYTPAAVCGNGDREDGEFAACEENLIPSGVEGFGENPVQVVTAIGEDVQPRNERGEVPPQQTDVIVQAMTLREDDGSAEDISGLNVQGIGDYTLQCGYTEFGSHDLLALRDGNMAAEGNEFWRLELAPEGADFFAEKYVVPPDEIDEDNNRVADALSGFGVGNTVLHFGNDQAVHSMIQDGLDVRVGQQYKLSFDSYALGGLAAMDYAVRYRRQGSDRYITTVSEALNGDGIVVHSESAAFSMFGIIEDVKIEFTTKQGAEAAIDNVRLETVFNDNVDFAQQNDCPDNVDNSHGVASNSCCYPRPARSDWYPQAQGQACRNTSIWLEFDESVKIAENSVHGNVKLLEGYQDPETNCAELGQEDVTAQVQQLLAMQAGSLEDAGVFRRIWGGIKQFFVRLFAGEVFAQAGFEDEVAVWCSGRLSVTPRVTYDEDEDAETVVSRIAVSLHAALEPDTTYGVLFLGGQSGIKNELGVSIRSFNPLNDGFQDHDFYTFHTGEEVCQVSGVTIAPPSQLYTAAGQSHQLTGSIITSSGGQEIQRIVDFYDWVWRWIPRENPLFTIPDDHDNTIDIESKNIEGTLAVVGQVQIIADEIGDTEGDVFSGFSELTSFFCANPWPSGEGAAKFEDAQFNYSMRYCADAGRAETTDDDLPFLSEPSISFQRDGKVRHYGDINLDTKINRLDIECLVAVKENDGHHECMLAPLQFVDMNCSGTVDANDIDSIFQRVLGDEDGEDGFFGRGLDEDRNNIPDCRPENERDDVVVDEDTLLQMLFFNEINEDIIGVQIFENPKDEATGRNKSANEWFQSKFREARPLQVLQIDGYEGVTDGNNFYIAALNQVDVQNRRAIYSNIYQFSINDTAQANTRDVFTQLLQSLIFNTNIRSFGHCLADEVVMPGGVLPQRFDDLDNLGVDADGNPVACSTDFDCRTAFGSPVEGTNGYCSSAREKFHSDWTRLHTVQNAQAELAQFHFNNGFYPKLAGGTFVPQYSNERWNSWELLPNLGRDPVGQWSACGRCTNPEIVNDENGNPIEQVVSCTSDDGCEGENNVCEVQDATTCWDPNTANFICPQFMSTYEYDTAGGVDYELHARLEYFAEDESIVTGENGFIDEEHFTTSPWCAPGELHSPFAGRCGDGVVNEGERCDPPNSISRGNRGLVQHVQEGACELTGEQCQVRLDCPFAGNVRATFQGIPGKADITIIGEPDKQGYCTLQDGNGDYVGFAVNQDIPTDIRDEGRDIRMHVVACNESIDCKLIADREPFERVNRIGVIHEDDPLVPIFDGTAEEYDDFARAEEYEHTCKTTLESQKCSNAGNVQGGIGQCPAGQTARVLCTETCQLEYDRCEAVSSCGNGIVEFGETCDDGARNGEYGQCAVGCEGRVAAACSNETLDFVDVDGNGAFTPGDTAYELCDEVGDVCTYLSDESGNRVDQNVYMLLDRSRTMNEELVNGTSKWEAATEAAQAIARRFDALVPDADPNFGVAVFPDKRDEQRHREAVVVGDPGIPELDENGQEIPIQRPSVEEIARREAAFLESAESNQICGSFRVDERVDLIESAGDQNRLRGFVDGQEPWVGGKELSYALRSIAEGDLVLLQGGQDAARPKTIVAVIDGLSVCERNNSPEEIAAKISELRRERHIATKIVVLKAPGVELTQDERNAFALWAAAGGQTYAVARNAQDIEDATMQSVGCQPYAGTRGNTCRADCQDFGAYCGDGIAQFQYGEQCDDGNNNPADACNNDCRTAVVDPLEAVFAGRCGDEIIQEGRNADGIQEQCDLGSALNGVECDPSYNQSCNYCSRDCRDTIQVDPVAFCGNQRLDHLGTMTTLVGNSLVGDYEACEIVNGEIFQSFSDRRVSQEIQALVNANGLARVGGVPYLPHLVPALCQDQGVPSCSADCRTFDSSGCVTCGIVQGASPLAYLTIHNVMGSAPGQFSAAKELHLIRSNRDLDPDGPVPPYLETIDFALGRELAFFNPILPDRLVSNNMCNGQYDVTVTSDDIGHLVVELFDPFDPEAERESRIDIVDLSLIADEEKMPYLDGQIERKKSGAFPYAVNAEVARIQNELLISPNVPLGYIRAVITWRKNADMRGASFVGNVYNTNLPYGPLGGNNDPTGRVSYSDVIANGPDELCSALAKFGEVRGMLQVEDYWWPTQCQDHGGRVYMNEIFEGEEIAAQATTIYVGTMLDEFGDIEVSDLSDHKGVARAAVGDQITDEELASHSPYGFFVQAITQVGGAQIGNFENYDVKVYIYEYQAGQNKGGLLPPNPKVYELNSARRSNNPLARYWQPFNMVPQVYRPSVEVRNFVRPSVNSYIKYQPVDVSGSANGVISTNFVDVICNVPDGICAREEGEI